MMATIERALFQEPRPSKMSDWSWHTMDGAGILPGCGTTVNGPFLSNCSMVGGPSHGPVWFLCGLVCTLRYAAELLPKSRILLTGLLRASGVLVGVVGPSSVSLS